MNLLFKINWSLRRAAIEDLRRRHRFVYERIGFLYCRAAATSSGLMVLAESYEPVADENYVKDDQVGGRINSAAIRAALQISLTRGVSVFYVHMHEHKGVPRPSRTDIVESQKLVPDFFNVTPSMPHGILIFSENSAFGLVWLGRSKTKPFNRIEVVGSPLTIIDFKI